MARGYNDFDEGKSITRAITVEGLGTGRLIWNLA